MEASHAQNPFCYPVRVTRAARVCAAVFTEDRTAQNRGHGTTGRGEAAGKTPGAEFRGHGFERCGLRKTAPLKTVATKFGEVVVKMKPAAALRVMPSTE